jgi:hypothetical protein
MVSSWIFHDINSTNEILPTFARYDNNYNICNVQPMHEGGLEMGIPNVDGDVHGVDEQHGHWSALGELVETNISLEATLLQLSHKGIL